MGQEATIEIFTGGSAYIEDAAQIYTEVFGGSLQDVRSFIQRYSTYDDFRGAVALSDGKVVGMGFGVRSVPGNWWHDKVAAEVGASNPALQDAWCLVELGVRAVYRGQGIGTQLQNALLQAQPLPRAILSTEVANNGSRRLYERLGWTYLHPGFVFTEGNEPYVVMCKNVRSLEE